MKHSPEYEQYEDITLLGALTFVAGAVCFCVLLAGWVIGMAAL